MPNKLKLKFRAHHLLCIQGFQGHGYDDHFVSKLSFLVESLRSDPNLLIEIVIGVDSICEPCPHHKAGDCVEDQRQNRKISGMDQKVSDLLGLKAGDTRSFQEWVQHVGRRIHTKSQLQNVCGLCEWQSKCSWYDGLNE